jgi:hypothetical protein
MRNQLGEVRRLVGEGLRGGVLEEAISATTSVTFFTRTTIYSEP